MNRLKAWTLPVAALLVSVLLLPILPTVRLHGAQFQAVLLHVGLASSPTALTATNGRLNVSVNGGNPSFTTVTATAGSGTGTFKSSGVLCDTIAGTCGCTAFTDAGVQNQWNVITCTLPASTLATNGDGIEIEVPWLMAANANAKSYQAYWNGGTCSGTGASMCATGTSIFSLATSNSANSAWHRFRIRRTSSGNQRIEETTFVGATTQDTTVTTAAVTDTGTIAFAFGCRNTAAAAACSGAVGPSITIKNFSQ
jgi:hypothetical protein